MKQKGFTLIELVMVILVLGIIAIITVPTVNVMIKDSKQKAYNNQIKMIEDTARSYMAKYSTELPSQIEGESTCITVENLKKNGLLSKNDILNPNYKENSTEKFEKHRILNGAIKVSWENSKYVYTYSDSVSC